MSAPDLAVPDRPAGEPRADGASTPKRTDPRSFAVRAIGALGQLALPVTVGLYTLSGDGILSNLAIIAAFVVAIIGLNTLAAYLQWRRLTYEVGAQDIRVESGLLSRTARSVPYERIQDVSLEQKLVPRMFGLVAVKFETGSGGGEDLSLTYLSEADGEALRRLVRERREDEDRAATLVEGEGQVDDAASGDEEKSARTLFAMDPQRLFTFGLFEFSLAVFAVLGGLLQYADSFIDFEIWDPDLWRSWVESQSGLLGSLGPMAQVLSAIAGVVVLLVVGSATGLVRTFLREWDFRLERTARGFRRRRGLLTRTDVMMPVHRVQALFLKTGILRYRFGWHALSFVSLAQDMGSANHVVAPFAKVEEIEPIMREAEFDPPADDLDWHRASARYRFDTIVIEAGFFGLIAIIVAALAPPLFALIPLAIGFVTGLGNLYAWRFHRHALDPAQIIARRGFLSPSMQIARRVKLHSVELSQGPIAQRRGYATLQLGLAGGTFAIAGLDIERARSLRAAILASIAETDFSHLNR